MEKTAESSGGGEDVPVETKSDGSGEEEKMGERGFEAPTEHVKAKSPRKKKPHT